MKNVRVFSFLFIALMFGSCIAPQKLFEKHTPPRSPDYTKESSWACLPTMKDSGDAVPYHLDIKDEQANAKVDVFYVHPTTYLGYKHWNIPIDDKTLNKRTDKYPIRHQASAFNGSCKVYAPRYRQATLYAFLAKNGDGHKALDLAYQDVKAAFLYYLQHYNNGRPFIIASHSQGTWHMIRLFKELLENDEQLRKQLVAAYLIGGPVTKNMFTAIAPCDSAGQINCYVAWHTMQWGKYFVKPINAYKHSAAFDNFQQYECTNPLSWKRDTLVADASLNKGAVPFKFNRIDVQFSPAKSIPTGELWSHTPKKGGYLRIKDYHIMDYNLFYINIRENVKLRVDNYLDQHPQ